MPTVVYDNVKFLFRSLLKSMLEISKLLSNAYAYYGIWMWTVTQISANNFTTPNDTYSHEYGPREINLHYMQKEYFFTKIKNIS